MGFVLLGLAGVLGDDGRLSAASPDVDPLAPKKPHFPGKARRLVHPFMNGGPAHVDTFDPKPLSAPKLRGAPPQRPPPGSARRRPAARSPHPDF
jgi:hypothetical protein